MALRDPFALRIAEIRVSFKLPPLRVLELVRPPDLEVLARRVLARIADDPDDPHAHVYLSVDVTDYRSFFAAVCGAVARSVEEAGEELAELGIDVPPPPEFEAGSQGGSTAHGESADAGEDGDEAPRRWARAAGGWLSAVGDALPDEAGSLVVHLEPRLRGGRGRPALGWALAALALHLQSDRVKLVVVHDGPDDLVPRHGELEDRIVRVDFAVSPEELEAEVVAALQEGGLASAEARRMRLLAGAFATSGGRFDEGEAHLRTALDEAREAGAPEEEANVLYNLGNLHARTGRHEDAAEALTGAARVALDTGNNGLAAMALTNLGVALYHEGRGQEAVDSLEAARTLFAALGHRPGEAHAVDCTARVWAASDPARARALWGEAAALYEAVEAPHLSEIREAGLADVRERLARLDGAGAG